MTPAGRLAQAIKLNQDLQDLQRQLRAMVTLVNGVQARAIAELADATDEATTEHQRLDGIGPPPPGSGSLQ